MPKNLGTKFFHCFWKQRVGNKSFYADSKGTQNFDCHSNKSLFGQMVI